MSTKEIISPAELPYVFDRLTALDLGVTDHQLRGSQVNRLSTGWYSTLTPADLQQYCRLLIPFLPADAVFSDTTAAMLLGLPLPFHIGGFDPDNPVAHITVPPGVDLRRRGLVVHRRQLCVGDQTTLDEMPITTPHRLLIDLASSWRRPSLLAVGDAILRQGLATKEEIESVARTQRRRRGIRTLLNLVPLFDGRAQSPAESIIRLHLHDAGIVLEPQCPVIDEAGNLLGHADLGDSKSRVAVEYEGRQHAEGEQFDRDIQRYTYFAVARWLVIRCGRKDLGDRCRRLIQQVRSAINR